MPFSTERNLGEIADSSSGAGKIQSEPERKYSKTGGDMSNGYRPQLEGTSNRMWDKLTLRKKLLESIISLRWLLTGLRGFASKTMPVGLSIPHSSAAGFPPGQVTQTERGGESSPNKNYSLFIT